MRPSESVQPSEPRCLIQVKSSEPGRPSQVKHSSQTIEFATVGRRCVHARARAHTCVRAHACLCTHVCARERLRVRVRACACALARACARTCVRERLRVLVSARMYARTRPRACSRKHVCASTDPLRVEDVRARRARKPHGAPYAADPLRVGRVRLLLHARARQHLPPQAARLPGRGE